MRKIFASLFILCLILFIVDYSFAQIPRDAIRSEGKNTFTNLAVTGLAVNGTHARTNPGVPGYLEMTSTAGDVFYIYVDYNGVLKIASDIAVGDGASPSTASWDPASGKAVGSQR